jgi:hypothetical protein
MLSIHPHCHPAPRPQIPTVSNLDLAACRSLNRYQTQLTKRQALTLIGAYLAIFTPGNYAADILPTKLEKLTQVVGDTIRGQMIIGGLGSCMLDLTVSLWVVPGSCRRRHMSARHSAHQCVLGKGGGGSLGDRRDGREARLQARGATCEV